MSRADDATAPAAGGDDDATGEFELSPGLNLSELVRRRQESNRDLAILITDANNERGTGKTILSLKLAVALNQSGRQLGSEHVFMRPEELTNAYTDLPPQSPLVLDEAEAELDKFNAGSSVARAMREIVSMGRVEEKYLIMNAPASTHIDRDLKSLFDVWITVRCRGEGLVHRLSADPYAGKTRTPKVQRIQWSDIPRDHHARSVYRHLTRQKRDRLDNDEDATFFSEQEVQERVRQEKREALREFRDKWLVSLNDLSGDDALSQQVIADTVPDQTVGEESLSVSRSQVSRVVNRE